ncbi:MAG: methyltransferase [Candidatus Baltobacteraceae bacterium]
MLAASWVVPLFTGCSDMLAKLRRRLMPRSFAAIDLGTMSWVAQSICAFCELGLPDALAHGPRTPADLAQRHFGNEAFLARLLRSLAAYDVVRYCGGSRYALGHVGKALTGPDSVAPMILYANAPWHVGAYAHLAQGVRAGRSGFDIAAGQELFAFLSADPDAGRVFDGAMDALNPLYARPFAQAYDFAHVRSAVDVGGGNGLLLRAVAWRFPHVRCTVFEMPGVVARANRGGEAVAFIAGDMFTDVPPPADCYILSHVLHDWDDAACTRILANVRAAMTLDSRLLVYELIAPPPNNRWSQDRITDLEMMAMLTGKERTREEFVQLFTRCGLRMRRVLRTAASESVIECVRDETQARQAAP